MPSRKDEEKDAPPYRYLAIRLRQPQERLFGDSSEAKHFAVVTNDWETPGQALLEWHRGKAGAIEQVHQALKDELGNAPQPRPPMRTHGFGPERSALTVRRRLFILPHWLPRL